MFGKIAITAGLIVLALAAPAEASVTISFAGGNSATSGSAGNIASYSSSGITVQASGWSFAGPTPTASWLGQYSNGLGVTNANEDGTSNNSSAIDNVNGEDFVLLVFSQPVSVLSAVLTPYRVGSGPADNDVTSSSVNLAGAFTLPVPTPISSSSSIWPTLLLDATSAAGNNKAPYVTAVTLGNNYGNVWLIGADMSGLDPHPDGFQLTSLNVAPSPVPEPSTWMMMLLGICAIGRVVTMRPPQRQFVQIA